MAEIYFYQSENKDNIILNSDSVILGVNSLFTAHSPFNYLNLDSCVLYPNIYSSQPYIYYFNTVENSNGSIKYIKNY